MSLNDNDILMLDRAARVSAASARSRPRIGRRAKAIWVDSTSKNIGTGSFDAPCRNVVSALVLCDPTAGDVIYVAAGHTETIAAAGGWTISKANVAIVGLGEGAQKPTISYSTSTGASILITGAGCEISGLHFNLQGIDGLTSPVHVQASSFSMLDCSATGGNASNQPVRWVLTTNSAQRMRIANCYFASATTDAGTTAVITIVGGSHNTIEYCNFSGAFGSGVGGIECTTTLTTNCTIQHNVIRNATASSTKAITMLTGSTGQIVNNRLFILSGSVPVTSDAMFWAGNYYTAAVATAGTLL